MPEVYAFFVIACFIKDPTICRQIKISDANVTEHSCNYNWMQLSVQWLEKNDPEWLTVRRVDCRDRLLHPRKMATALPKE